MIELSAHLNWLFEDDVPVEARLRRSAGAGAAAFGWNPWGLDLDTDAIRDIAATGGELDLDMAYMSCTHLPVADPAERDGVIDTLGTILRIAGDVGCHTVNVLAGGHCPPERDPGAVDDHIVDVLATIAPTAADHGVTVLIEHSNPIDLPERYLQTVEQCLTLLERVDHDYVKFLFDVYHQQLTAGNIFGVLDAHHPWIDHIHIAGVPGRRRPGAGELNYGNILQKLRSTGYAGYVECEFVAHDDPEGSIEAVDAILTNAR